MSLRLPHAVARRATRGLRDRATRGLRDRATRGRTDRARRGLTLIELAIVLAVMLILGTLALPPMGRVLERQRLIATAEALVADVADARHEAAQSGNPVHLRWHAGAQWCWAVARQNGCACGEAQACQLKRVGRNDHPGVSLVNAAAVEMQPDGRAAQTAQAELVAGQERLRVVVSTMGRAHLCAPDGPLKRIPRCAA